MSDMSIKAADVGSGLMGLAKITAALFVSLSVIGGAVWFAFQPRVDGYMQGKIDAAITPLLEQIASVSDIVSRTDLAISGQKRPDYVQIRGVILVREKGPFEAGDVVPMIAHLRRNAGCPTTIQVRFINATTGTIDSSLTYEIPSTRAPITLEFQSFPINIRLPDKMPAGRWSYAPLLVPDRNICPSLAEVSPSPSEFFDVE